MRSLFRPRNLSPSCRGATVHPSFLLPKAARSPQMHSIQSFFPQLVLQTSFASIVVQAACVPRNPRTKSSVSSLSTRPVCARFKRGPLGRITRELLYDHISFGRCSGGGAYDRLGVQLFVVVFQEPPLYAPLRERLHSFGCEHPGIQFETNGWLVIELSAVPPVTTPGPLRTSGDLHSKVRGVGDEPLRHTELCPRWCTCPAAEILHFYFVRPLWL